MLRSASRCWFCAHALAGEKSVAPIHNKTEEILVIRRMSAMGFFHYLIVAEAHACDKFEATDALLDQQRPHALKQHVRAMLGILRVE